MLIILGKILTMILKKVNTKLFTGCDYNYMYVFTKKISWKTRHQNINNVYFWVVQFQFWGKWSKQVLLVFIPTESSYKTWTECKEQQFKDCEKKRVAKDFGERSAFELPPNQWRVYHFFNPSMALHGLGGGHVKGACGEEELERGLQYTRTASGDTVQLWLQKRHTGPLVATAKGARIPWKLWRRGPSSLIRGARLKGMRQIPLPFSHFVPCRQTQRWEHTAEQGI